MSGYPTGSGSGGNDGRGLDSLFAQLRQQQNQPAAPVHLEPSYNYYNNNNNNNGFFGQNQQLPHYQQPSVSSPLPTPPVHGQQPHHNSAIMSPVETPHAEPRLANPVGTASNDNRTSSLLNLLKFSQPSATKQNNQAAPISTPLPPSRESSMSFGGNSDVLGQVSVGNRGGQDLLAALMGGAQQKPVSVPQMTQASPQFANASQPQSISSFAAATSPPTDTQAYLLRLLNQPKPPQTGDQLPHLNTEKVATPPSKVGSSDDVGDLAKTLENTKIEMDMSMMGSSTFEGKIDKPFGKENAQDVTPQPKNNQGLFTYVNPFEELAASSPRNRTPKATTAGPSNSNVSAPAFQILKRQDSSDNKRKMDERSNVDSPGQAFSKRKLGSPAVSSGPPTPLPDGRTQLEALIGIGAPSPSANGKGKETVSHALEEVGDTVDHEVQEALARAEKEATTAEIEKDLRNMLAAKTETQFEDRAQVAATAIKKVLDKDETIFDDLPTPVADEVKEIIDDAAHGHIADSWESADAEDTLPKYDESVIQVFNFPMKPWTSITIKNSEEGRPIFRDEIIIDIARLKKEFDQIDRTLVTASSNFIVYGMSKNGGIRIIRQADGKDSRLFTETHDRIFNVSTSSAPADLKETIIGTGISGTVYWAIVKDGEGDFIEENHPEMHGFALPPIQTPDNESAGGVLKTRARKSSNHPEFFAVGRGKSIQIIYPSVIMKNSFLKNGKERIVDTDRYLAHRSLKVNTGKAGKDFTFSEDDTTIVSLDKAGRVKFWDVRPLTQIPENELHQKAPPVEIKEPLTTLITTPATEKSWPTSVLFVDKLRPYQKGGPLRYMIVGMKQNHTLQLWDLALGKPVQEIHLPHSKESDAVCSVLYHPATGVIVVGHPTRNSIYFLHLSAPKYNLPRTVTQAEYVEKLANNDSSVSKPDSTAVVSGMREYSFASKGNLRSLDILQNPASPPARGEPITLFELYAMHSKGVTCLNIKQADLGWDVNNKCISAVVADRVGAVTIDTLKEINTAPPATPSESSDPIPEPAPAAVPTPTRIIQRPAAKDNSPKETKRAAQAEPSTSVPKAEEKAEKKEGTAALTNGGLTGASGTENKAEKKKRRKANSSSEPAANSSQTKNVATDNNLATRNGSASRANMTTIPDVGTSSSFSATGLTEDVLKDIEGRVSGEVKKLLNDSFNILDQKIKDDRRTQNAVSDAKQDAVLRLVSSTLTGNMEESLKRIVNGALENSIVPAIENITLKTVDQRVAPALVNHLNQSLPKELQKILPDAVNKVMQQPQLLKLMSETLAKSVSFPFEEQFATLLNSSITPAFTQLAVNTSQRVAADVHRQAQEQIGNIERQRHADSLKIEQLTQLVTGLTETISSMAAAQSEFQAQFLRVQQRDRTSGSSHRASPGLGHSSSRPSVSSALAAPPIVEKSQQELEYEEMFKHIQVPMQEGRYEDAVVRWLQTGREQEFFARYFCKFSPKFITELSPLLLLSLGAIITIELTDDLMNPRLIWTETILNSFQIKMVSGYLEDQVADLVPKIMNIYVQRLEHLFMRITNVAPQDPLLKQLSQMVATANRILELYRERPVSRHMVGFPQ